LKVSVTFFGRKEKEEQEEVTISDGISIKVHPDFFRTPPSKHAIAFLTLQHPFFHDILEPPLAKNQIDHQNCLVYHYGWKKARQRTLVDLLSFEKCISYRPSLHRETQLCASDPNKSIFMGDSGSPLVCISLDNTPCRPCLLWS